PRAIEPLTDGRRRLEKRWPDELISAEDEGHDERPEPALAPGVRVDHEAHLAEIDLRLLTGRRIVDPNGRRLFSPRELLMGEPPERVVARRETVIADEQRVDLRQLQRSRVAVPDEPALDQGTVLGHLIPLVAGRHERPCLYALGNLVDHVIGQLAAPH